MRNLLRYLTLAGALAAALLPGTAAAQLTDPINELKPGSLLIFPVINSKSGFGTVIAVTNTNTDKTVVTTNNFHVGDVQVHFYYVEKGTCQINNRVEFLSPGDIFAQLASKHSTESVEGYMFAVAEDPETGKPIDFDYLIGDEIIVDTQGNRSWAVKAIPVRALAQERSQSGPRSQAGFLFTQASANGGNDDQHLDFDGREYQYLPDELFLSSFLEFVAGSLETELVLVAPFHNDVRVDVDFLFYDNEEDVFSRDFRFQCWTKVKLTSVSQVVKNLGGASTEVAAGWARINGDMAIDVLTGRWSQDPPVLGAMVQTVTVGQTAYQFGHLLHMRGANSGSFNGSLPGRRVP